MNENKDGNKLIGEHDKRRVIQEATPDFWNNVDPYYFEKNQKSTK